MGGKEEKGRGKLVVVFRAIASSELNDTKGDISPETFPIIN